MFKKSILAGMMISIGCIIFLQTSNNIVGSFLFSLGLLSVCSLKLNLYTGKIGYLTFSSDDAWYDSRRIMLPDIFEILVGNLIGCILVALLSYGFVDIDKAVALCEKKEAVSLPVFFFKSIFCGTLMFTAVHIWKMEGRVVGSFAVVFCVMVFILAGFEHSIADTYYFLVSMDIDGFLLIPIAILGNAVGGMLTFNLAEADKHYTPD